MDDDPRRSPKSTRILIFTLLATLIVIVWIEVVRDALEHMQDYAGARAVIEANDTVDHLLHAGQNFAFERGRTNVVLRAAQPVSANDRAFIDNRRRLVDGHLATMLQDFAGTPSVAILESEIAALTELRRQVDLALALPAAERRAGIADRWLDAATGLLAKYEALMTDISLGSDHDALGFRMLSRAKIMAFRLRNALGMESSRIATGIASGQPLAPAALNEIARLRGESTATWEMLKKEVALADRAELTQSLAVVDDKFFNVFRPLQDRAIAASIAGEPYPFTTADYTGASVPALDSIATVMDAAVAETQAYGIQNMRAARTGMAIYIGMAVTVLALGVATLFVVVTRLLLPLRQLQHQLGALGAGRLDIPIPKPTHYDEMGMLQQAVITFRDSLVERQAMADELAVQSERLHTLINAMPDFVCFKDGKGRWLIANDYGIALFGLKGTDYLAKTDGELAELSVNCRQSLCGCSEGDERAWRRGQSTRSEEVVTGADGTARFFDVVKVPLLDHAGGRRGIVVVGRDISERRRIEAALARLSRQNELILECAGEGIIGIDGEGRTVFVNPAASRMTGWEMSDLMGQSHHRLVHHTHPDGSAHPAEQCPIALTLTDGVSRQCLDDVFWRKDGSSFAVEFMATPMLEQGQVKGAVVVFRDISERKRSEAEIETLLDELRRSNADLEQFAYAISHDLQEPLRMVASYVQLLARRYQGKLDAEADEFIAFASDGAARMFAMINALLEYARVNTRGGDPHPVDTGTAVHIALSNLTVSVAETGAEIVVPDNLPAVMGDQTQLARVFQNLIANAIKYVEPDRRPQVVIEVHRTSAMWTFAVVDNGIGIPDNDRDRVFGVFQRLEARPDVSGTGMGLAICKRVIERLGGRIWVEANPEGGSRFVFTVPAVD